jgi:2'-hydroxyisoflavone reductase
MDILLLGGYRFLGRAIIGAAQARGHAVSAFNRGNLTPLPGVEQLTGERESPVFPQGRRWDAVVDTSGYVPRHVRSAASALRDRIDCYAFVSSLSVYPFPMPPNVDETAALLDDASYGGQKAACEAVLDEVLPGRALAVRAGFIVGPYDNTDRFNTWIERAARPEPFILPGDPAAPLQLIDARDLGEWIVQMAERRAAGAYNVTGPERPLRAGDVAQTCIDATGSSAEIRVEPSTDPWEALPLCLKPDEYGIMQANIDRALASGLQVRPLADTVRDTHAWLVSRSRAR